MSNKNCSVLTHSNSATNIESKISFQRFPKGDKTESCYKETCKI